MDAEYLLWYLRVEDWIFSENKDDDKMFEEVMKSKTLLLNKVCYTEHTK